MKTINRLPGRQSRRSKGTMQKIVAAAPLIGFAVFGIFPLVISVFMSFSELHTARLSDMKFVGLENFKNLISPNFLSPIISTLFPMLYFPITTAIYILVADRIAKVNKKLRAIYCTVTFIPSVMSSVSIALIFKQLYRADSGGMLNSFIGLFGFEPVDWLLTSPVGYFTALEVKSLWCGMGWKVLMLLACLNNIDKSYYEAAEIDGATKWQQFKGITLPALTPFLGYQVTMSLIGYFQSMGDSILMPAEGLYWWDGAGAWVSDTIGKNIYNMIFVNPMASGSGYGPAAATGWILALVIFFVTWVNNKTQEKWVCYDF